MHVMRILKGSRLFAFEDPASQFHSMEGALKRCQALSKLS